MVYTNQIIEGVRKYPVLFDTLHTHYKSRKVRDEAWNELALELHESRDELRKKWKNIRDCYKKYLRSVTDGGSGILRSYKNWQWADCMDFCKPFVLLTETELQNPDNNDDLDDEFSETTNASVYENEEEKQVIPEAKKSSEPVSPNKINQFQHNREQLFNNVDATDLIFLGYSSIIKSFTPTKQAIVKMKIAQVIMEEELQHAEGIAHQSQLICKPSSGNGVINKSKIEVTGTDHRSTKASSNVKSTKHRRVKRKRKRSSSEEDSCKSNFATINSDGEISDLKTETKDVSSDG